MRHCITLASSWTFAPDLDAPAVVETTEPKPPTEGWRPVRVPGFWQQQFRDLSRSAGVGWYSLRLDLDATYVASDSLTVEFGAVSHFSQGWMNGRYLGAHEGGHLPFSWSLKAAARLGINELLVRVVSPSGDRTRFRDFPFEETLHGKQSWYGPAGGLWQEVTLEARSAHALAQLDLRADAARGTVTVCGHLADAAPADPALRIDVRILDPDAVEVGRTSAVPGVPATVELDQREMRWWSPDTPSLYRVEATLSSNDRDHDSTTKTFGFRTFTTDSGKLLLNGDPVMMRGVLDQDYWDGPGVPTSRQDLVDRFMLVKSMGFNTLRCHIKIPDPRYLDVADEIGLLVWCEMPTTTRLTHAARRRIEETLEAVIARDRHHPSIVVWGIANEAWGYDLGGNAEHRAWLNHLYHRAKADVADVVVVDNSACATNFHIETDIEDYHFYAVLPEMRQQWTNFLDAFAERADFTFSPHGDAIRTGNEPLVVSEFGSWGLPDLSDLADSDGREPWWFETGQEWADGAAYVHGAAERFALWHLDQVFGSWAGLCDETQRRQFETMREQIESMRIRPEIAGYVLTELSDVHWEANGLLDMTGRPRNFATQLAAVNASPTVIAMIDRAAVWEDETIDVHVTALNDDQARPRTSISCGLTGTVDATTTEPFTLQPGGRRTEGAFEVVATGDGVPRLAAVQASLVSEGSLTVTASKPLLVVPRLGPQLHPDQHVGVADPVLAERLRTMGYTVDAGSASSLRVMQRLETDDHDFISDGGRGLLLADDTDAFGDGFGEYPKIQLSAWRDALFGGGEWVSAFSWLRRSGRFADLPGGPMMDSYFEGLTPQVVITGIPPASYEYDVLAGVFVGWVHQVAALVAQHHAGLGGLHVSTLRLTEQPVGVNPLADWLLHQLIATAWEQL